MGWRKTLTMLTLVGETMVLIGAVIWSWLPDLAVYVFVGGTCLFLAGRMLNPVQSDDITIRRLQTQQKVGALILLLAAITMVITPTWFLGYYLTKSAWLIPFLVFVIIEVYTTFRLSYLNNNQQK
jgi:tryptophan-rich sensory protein